MSVGGIIVLTIILCAGCCVFPWVLPQILDKVKENKEKRDSQSSGSNIHWGRLIGIGAVVIFIIYVLIAGSSNPTTSYYMDYNGNGNMDKGEWAWDEDSNGNTIDYDWNGDGLYDWQD